MAGCIYLGKCTVFPMKKEAEKEEREVVCTAVFAMTYCFSGNICNVLYIALVF